MLISAGLFWLIFFLLARNIRKAGLIVSAGLILFFSFGHLRDIITPLMWQHPQRILFAVICIIMILSTILLLRTKKTLEGLTYFANLVGIVLVLISIITAVYEFSIGQSSKISEELPISDYSIPENPPDIYYLIADGYARSDIMKKLYGFDNSRFIDYLNDSGFFVVEKGLANYSQTVTSLPSSLNMTYLDDIAGKMGPGSANVIPLVDMLKDNRVASFLKNIGYKTVAFSSGYWDTEIKDADIFLSPDSWILTDFQSLVLDMTPIPKILSKIYSLQYDSRRKILTFMLNTLSDLPETESPKFVFAHIAAPHEPYVFGKDGEPVEPSIPVMLPGRAGKFDLADYHRRYCNFAQWLNGELIRVIDNILSDSTRKPVIILQADHGLDSYLGQGDSSAVGLIERMAILNAYYLPDGDYSGFYDSITPVNSFRLLFDKIFETDLRLLEDRCYFSRFDTPYKFVDVTEIVTKPMPDNIAIPIPNPLKY